MKRICVQFTLPAQGLYATSESAIIGTVSEALAMLHAQSHHEGKAQAARIMREALIDTATVTEYHGDAGEPVFYIP